MSQPPAKKQPSIAESWWWRWCSQFIANHKPAVTILSALTVLGGFVVKDVLDEPKKDLLSSIQAAELDNNQEQSALYTQLTDINANLDIVRNRLISGQIPSPADLQLRKLQTERMKTFELIGQNYGHLVVLEPILSTPFKDDKAKFDASYRALQADDPYARQRSSTDDTAAINALAQSLAEWQRMFQESVQIRGEGLKELIELKEQTELLHRIYEWIAYVAFGLGWVVGLISNLVESKVASPGE
jgi:hypothetical protein